MPEQPTAAIEEHFKIVQDPRDFYPFVHPLINRTTIALSAIIAGTDKRGN